MRVLPSELLEVISLTPAMRPKERSNGVATDEAMVSGEAPGSEALTIITGKIDLRQRGDRQQTKAQNAAQRNGGGNQNGGDRAVDEKGEKAASTPPLYGAESDFSRTATGGQTGDKSPVW
ncbi:Uncharacterised protein [Salmonella enterica subsp. enterica serovar Typhimurium]|nr:Uncharacterised protein [Salmonella enterica subsp. enterica serovar Typhimurium]